jgi:hypothetical protein
MNSWIVQATPKEFLIDWFLDEFIKSNPDYKDWWLIERRYQNAIRHGDVIYVWKAASEPPHYMAEEYFAWLKSIGRIGQVAGIFAVGEIQSFPKSWWPPRQWNDQRLQKYWIAKDKLTPGSWVDCIYTDNRARNPLLQETIWEKWEKLGQSTPTDFGGFKKRRNRRLVKLKPREANVIGRLLANSK